MKFNLKCSYVTLSEMTERTMLVAESFGLGLDNERTFEVIKEAELDLRPGDIVYVTGDSGGGKSTILSLLKEKLENCSQFSPIGCDPVVPDEEILIEGAGSTFEEALRNLSIAGLNDAFLMIRKYRELSEGQKYRYRICKLLNSPAKTLLFDEFLATLDRDTAKVVAFCLQKTAKRMRKTLIVATTHEDLIRDLSPSVLIRKGFGPKIEISYPDQSHSFGSCTLSSDITINSGTREDYQKLHMFHYRAELPTTTRKIYSAFLKNELIGVIAYGAPPLHSSARTKFLGYSPSAIEVNEDFLTITRVVVHPKFRGMGLGARLVRDTLALVQKKYVETSAVMARFNPFFEKAGMQRIDSKSESAEQCKAIIAKITDAGFRVERPNDLDLVPDDKYLAIAKELSSSYFALRDVYGHDSKIDQDKVLDDLIRSRALGKKIIAKIQTLSQDKAYYAWRNEKL
ncbi:MAG: GNAT family N-acetyltransferase [Nitrososphaerales archaeon]